MISDALQKVVVARLKADPVVNGLVAGRVYDMPPATPASPYISIGPDTVEPDRADCYEGSNVTFQVDAWSRAPNFGEVKRVAEAARAAITETPLVVPGYRVVDASLVEIRTFRDPDGLTSHSALSFRAVTEPV